MRNLLSVTLFLLCSVFFGVLSADYSSSHSLLIPEGFTESSVTTMTSVRETLVEDEICGNGIDDDGDGLVDCDDPDLLTDCCCENVVVESHEVLFVTDFDEMSYKDTLMNWCTVGLPEMMFIGGDRLSITHRTCNTGFVFSRLFNMATPLISGNLTQKLNSIIVEVDYGYISSSSTSSFRNSLHFEFLLIQDAASARFPLPLKGPQMISDSLSTAGFEITLAMLEGEGIDICDTSKIYFGLGLRNIDINWPQIVKTGAFDNLRITYVYDEEEGLSCLGCNTDEICDNGIDDDGDGFVDCFDPECDCYAPFECGDQSFYQTLSIEDDKMGLFRFNADLMGFEFIANLTDNGLDQIVTSCAINPVDGFMYAMRSGFPQEFYRIDRNGNVQPLGNLNLQTTGQLTSGTFDANGIYYVLGSEEAMYGVDVDPSSPDYLQVVYTLENLPFQDIDDAAISPMNGRIYGIDRVGQEFFEIDVSTNSIVNLGDFSNLNSGTYGSCYFTTDNFFIGYINQTGDIFRIDLDQNPPFEVEYIGFGPMASFNDGASNPFCLDFFKSAVDTIFQDSLLRYTFEIFNNTTMPVDQLLFCDTLVDGLQFASNPLNVSSGIVLDSSLNIVDSSVALFQLLEIDTGFQSFDILVRLDCSTPEVLSNQAFLKNDEFDVIPSDDPSTIVFNDATTTINQNGLDLCVEICDNGIDDDGDGLIDCYDDSDCPCSIVECADFCCDGPVAYYDFDDCLASPGETAVYDEFQPLIACDIPCAVYSATEVLRVPSHLNRHSCTVGQSGEAMCVGAQLDCDFQDGSEKAVIFELIITPDSNSVVSIDSLSFFENAPLEFDWIDGASGLNNYPTLYGLRVLVNDIEVFKEIDIPTSQSWSLEEFSFADILVESESRVRFELLPYCVIGNGSNVYAWDIDEMGVFASCSPRVDEFGSISGSVLTKYEEQPTFALELADLSEVRFAETEVDGGFVFQDIPFDSDYSLAIHDDANYSFQVSTFDLLRIQQHLLGLTPFDKDTDLRAADANMDGFVSALDIIELRKLLLGYQNTFSSPSWVYISEDGDQTLAELYANSSHHTIESYSGSMELPGFMAIKVGDLGPFDDDRDLTLLELRENKKATVNCIQESDENEKHFISLRFENSWNHMGMQFGLCIPKQKIIGVESDVFDISPSDYSFDEECIYFSKLFAERQNFDSGLEFLRILIQPHSDMQNLEKHHAFSSEIYRSVSELPIEMDFELISSVYGGDLKQNSISVSPNPSTSNIVVEVGERDCEKLHLTLSDAKGATVYRKEFGCNSNVFEILDSELPRTGVYYLQILADGEPIGIYKIVRLF